MARPLKIILGIIAALLVIVIVTVTVVLARFDPNDYRDDIAAAVKQKTGRDLVIGDIRLSVFPWIKVKLSDLTLSNAPGFSDKPFAAIKEASVGVRLMPLLMDRELQVSTVKLDGARLSLERKADGSDNWSDLATAASGQDQPNAAPQAHTDKGPEQGTEQGTDQGTDNDTIQIAGVTVQGLEISDASARYVDGVSGETWNLSDLHLQTGELKPDHPVEISASMKAAAEQQQFHTEIAVAGTVTPSEDHQKFDVQDLQLQVSAELARAMQLKSTLSGRVTADLQNKTWTLASLDLKSTVTGAKVPQGSQSLELTGAAIYDQGQGTLSLQNASLDALGINARISLEGTGLGSDQSAFKGPIVITPFNGRKVLTALGKTLDSEDPNTFSNVALQAQLNATPKAATLSELRATVDDSVLSGQVAVTDFKTRAIRFALKLNQIDADRYLPPKAPEQQSTAGQHTEEAPLDDMEIPAQALKDLNLAGTLDIGQLTLRGLKMSDVQIKLDGPAGASKTASINARLYQGTMAGTASLAPTEPARVGFGAQLSGVQLEPLLTDFSGKDRISGTGDIQLKLAGAGNTVGALKKDLDGTLQLAFRNGAVKGFNIGHIIRDARARLRGEALASNEPQQTDFTSISLSGTITKGVLTSDDLDARSPLLRVGGKGWINLINKTLDYTAEPTIVATAKGQGGSDLADLNGLTIPLHFTGSIDAPKIGLDLQAAMKQKAAQDLRERVDERKEELIQRLDERAPGIGNALQNLFNRRKKQQDPQQNTTPDNNDGT